MAFTFKLQSPTFNGAGTGMEIPLAVSIDSLQGSSLASIITLFSGKNKVLDFSQLREIVSLVGVITDGSAVDAGFDNAVHYRDALRSVRADGAYVKSTGSRSTPWTTEGPGAGSWNDGTLPAAERDSNSATNARGKGKIRLIADVYWNDNTNAVSNLFVYGTVGDITFGPRAAASGRIRIPYRLTFLAGEISAG